MQELREATGLTQQQLADFVQIDRSRIAMCEGGFRPMPLAAMQQLTQLFLLVPTNTDSKNLLLVADELAQQKINAKQATILYKQQCSLKLQRKQKKLQRLITNYNQCMALLQALRSLAQQLPTNKNNSYQHAWIRLTEQETLDQLATCSLAQQQILQLQIQQLQVSST